MDLSSIIYALTTFFLLSLLRLLKSRNITAHAPSPPKATGSRPFTGHLHIFNGLTSELPHIELSSLSNIHGPIFTIDIGLRPAVVVSSFELTKELFTVHDSKISSKPRTRATEILSRNHTMFGFAPYGEYWRKMRKIAIVELLSNRRVEMMRPIRESEIGAAIKELYKMSSDGDSVEMKKWFEEFNVNLTLMMVTGKRFDDAEKHRLIEMVNDFFRYAGTFLPADSWPVLSWLDLGGFEKRMKETAKELEEIVGRWLVEAENQRKEYSGEDRPQSFMDVLLEVLPSAELQSDIDAIQVINSTCQNMILGSIDTTAVTLTWALSLLLKNPTTLRLVQEELDNKIGRHRLVNESDLKDLVYLHAVIKETFRLYAPGPLGILREFTDDCVIGGFHIQKGTLLFVNLWKLHRDPSVWVDESEFRPERFLDPNKSIDFRGQDFEFIPFGSGRRMCVAVNLGSQVIHSALANLLHAFEIKTIDGQLVDMSAGHGLTSAKVAPLGVTLTPRLDQNVYTNM